MALVSDLDRKALPLRRVNRHRRTKRIAIVGCAACLLSFALLYELWHLSKLLGSSDVYLEWPGCLKPSLGFGQTMSPIEVKTNLLADHNPPTGLVVTLLHDDHRLLKCLCALFPSQLTHFIVPHQLDVLFVVSGNVDESMIVECLNLAPTSRPKPKRDTWRNLDGTTLVTTEYQTITVIGSVPYATKVFLASSEVSLPKYIREDLSLLETAIEPPMCRAPVEYIQGTRWYSKEMLHLGILTHYDFWIKLDPDVVFLKPIPVHLLHDMRIKGAIFGHTAMYPANIPSPCSTGIKQAISAYLDRFQTFVGSRAMCSEGNPLLEKDSDRYYTNFVIGRTDYFQSPEVLSFGSFLSEYHEGFFKYRWTDQIFFHFALGLFLTDFDRFVADYTDFRCAPVSNCWMSSLEKHDDMCANDGMFVHSKGAIHWASRWNRHMALDHRLPRNVLPYESTYHHDCSGTRWE